MIQITSLQAFLKIQSSLNGLQRAVLNAIRTQPNVTDAETTHLLGWTINRITPRRGELVKLGLVGEVEKRRCRITKNQAIAWRAVPMPSAFPAKQKEDPKPVAINTQQQLS